MIIQLRLLLVQKTTDEQFVYSLQLNENKSIKPSPPVENRNRSCKLGAQQLYDNSILPKIKNVNRKISGTDMDVGRVVSEADFTNEVLRLAKESGYSDLIRAAEKYETYKFNSDTQRYRAIGSLAKNLGVTYGDLIRSKANSLADRFVTAISNIDTVDGRIHTGIEKERTSAKARNDTITLAALDYLENILDREGAVIAVEDVFRTNNYSSDNPNTAVEVYADSIEKGFHASGLDISVSVYYDNSDTAIRGEWSVDEKGHTQIKLNGSMLRGEQSAFWVLSHELFHEAELNSPGITKRVLDVFSDMGIYNEEKQYEAYHERYQSNEDTVAKAEKRDAETLSRDYIESEIAADLVCETMGSTELLEMFAGKLRDDDANVILSFFKRIAGGIKKAIASSGNKFSRRFSEIVTEFEKAVKNEEAKKDLRSTETRLSIFYIPGIDKQYVNVGAIDITDDDINNDDAIGRKARLYLRNHFRGVVLPVGKTKSAYVRSEAINEVTNPAKYIDAKEYNGKMLAMTELDNLLKSSEYLGWEKDDGRHQDVKRWLNYETIFLVKVDGKPMVLKGKVRIKRIERGDCFYDITQIKNITHDNMGQSIISHAAQSADDAIESIAHPDEIVKSKSALSSKL